MSFMPLQKPAFGLIGSGPQKKKRSFADVMSILGAGFKDLDPHSSGGNLNQTGNRLRDRDAAAYKKQAQLAQQQQKLAQANKTADQYGLKGRERLAYLTNPDEYGKNLSTNYGAATVGTGAARVYGNGASPYVNKDTLGQDKLQELIRSNKAGEALTGQSNDTSRMNAQTSRMEAQQLDLPTGMTMGPNGPQYIPEYIAGQNQMRAAGRTNVTVEGAPQVGAIPKGYQLKDDNGTYRMEPIAGGPVANANKARKNRAQTAGGTVLQDIGRALENVQGNNLASGPLAGQTRFVPGSPADVTNKHVQSALSNIGIDQLQSMRDASPTGGALGQIPVQQQKRLEQMLGSLDVTQPDDIMQDNLMRVQNIYNDIVHGDGQGPERHQLSFDEQGRSVGAQPPTVGAIHKGHEYLGGDPSNPKSWRKK